MEDIKPPFSLRNKLARVSTVVACVTLCSAVVGAGAKPVPEKPAVPAVASYVPVEMVAVSERAPAKSVAFPVEAITPAAPKDPASDELMREIVPALPAPKPAQSFRIMRMEVTAYCPCKKCCGPNAQGLTASGRPVSHNNGLFVAADTTVLPFGTRLLIPGYAANAPVEVIDRGGAIKGNKIDVYFDDHQQAKEWGRRFVDVVVAE